MHRENFAEFALRRRCTLPGSTIRAWLKSGTLSLPLSRMMWGWHPLVHYQGSSSVPTQCIKLEIFSYQLLKFDQKSKCLS